uniref:Uncharacterized protein n=1 Tax=Opuntia streptacantha TaxID=393608 RepID=A0A7C8ZDU9_OPUST
MGGMVFSSTSLYSGLTFPCKVNLMSVPSPTPPLSFSSSSDGSVDYQDRVSSPTHLSQFRVPSVLDGCRFDNHGQPTLRQLPTYSTALKLRVGDNSSPNVPSSESKLCPKLRKIQSPGLLSLGQVGISDYPSNPTASPQANPTPLPSISTDELLACCLLGRIWGEPIPLPTIIHRTRND